MFKFLFGSQRSEYVLEGNNGVKHVMQREECQTVLQVNGEDYVVNMVNRWHEDYEFSIYSLSDGKYSVLFVRNGDKVTNIYTGAEQDFKDKHSTINVANIVWLWSPDGDYTGKLELSLGNGNNSSSGASGMQMVRELSEMLDSAYRSREWMEVAIDHELNS